MHSMSSAIMIACCVAISSQLKHSLWAGGSLKTQEVKKTHKSQEAPETETRLRSDLLSVSTWSEQTLVHVSQDKSYNRAGEKG